MLIWGAASKLLPPVGGLKTYCSTESCSSSIFFSTDVCRSLFSTEYSMKKASRTKATKMLQTDGKLSQQTTRDGKASSFLLDDDDDDDNVEEDEEDPGGHVSDGAEAAAEQWSTLRNQSGASPASAPAQP